MTAWFSAGRVFIALLTALTLASACGGDGSSAPPAGGAAAPGSTGGSNAAASGGAAGGGNEGGAESGGSTSSSRGGFDSIWKKTTADVLVIDTASAAIPTQVTVKIPDLYSVPYEDASVDVEVYQSIQDGALLTYAWPAGAASYYRIKSRLSGGGDSYGYSPTKNLSGFYQLMDGVLTFMSSFRSGTVLGTSTTHFEKYTGDFPPADWPSDVVELDLTTGAAQ